MPNPRRRAIAWAAASLVVVWSLAGAGHQIARNSRATAENVAAVLHENNPEALAGESRSNTLNQLARQMASLPVEERRRARMDESWARWFLAMSDAEKKAFLDATLPSGVRQMIASFEALPEDKRRRAVNDAMRDLRRAREAEAAESGEGGVLQINTNRPPMLSEALQQQFVKSGLSGLFSNSTPQTLAELAPLLEEMQRLMESGRYFRGERR